MREECYCTRVVEVQGDELRSRIVWKKRTLWIRLLNKYYIFRRDLWVIFLIEDGVSGNESIDDPNVLYWQRKIR